MSGKSGGTIWEDGRNCLGRVEDLSGKSGGTVWDEGRNCLGRVEDLFGKSGGSVLKEWRNRLGRGGHNFPLGMVSFVDGISTDPLRQGLSPVKGSNNFK